MAENTSVPSQGTNIYSGTYGGAITTALSASGIEEIGGFPTLTADEYEKTRINQSDLIKQFAAALIDSGTLVLKIGMTKADVTAAYALIGSTIGWKIVFYDTSYLTFRGWLKKIGPEGSKGKEVLFAIEIRVTGGLTFA